MISMQRGGCVYALFNIVCRRSIKHSGGSVFARQFLLFAALFFLFSCKEKEGSAPAGEPLVIGVQSNCFSALVLIAKEKGFFEKEGVAVTLKFYPSGKVAHQALLRGEVDLCTVADMPIAVGGILDSSRIIATIGKTNREKKISARVDRGIRSVKDLKGKRIGTQKNSAVHFFLSVLLTEHLLSEDSLEVVFLPAAELPDALERGDIDAFSMRNPFSSDIKARMGNRITEFYSTIYLSHLVLAKHATRLQSKDDDIQRILKALIVSEHFCYNNPNAAIAAIAEALPGDRLLEVQSDFNDYNFSVGLDKVLLLTLERQYSWKYPQLAVLPDFIHRFEAQYLKRVNPSLVSVGD